MHEISNIGLGIYYTINEQQLEYNHKAVYDKEVIEEYSQNFNLFPFYREVFFFLFFQLRIEVFIVRERQGHIFLNSKFMYIQGFPGGPSGEEPTCQQKT